jgi:iron:rusticyanin reductase
MIRKNLLLLVILTAALTMYQEANAVPSYARQTGLACQSCHTVFPELNAFGRSFKLHGYTMTNIKQVSAKQTPTSEKDLSIGSFAPFSAMLVIDATHKKADTPTTNVNFPDELSLFYAGEISPHMGSFIQLTLEGADGTFGMDNTDIRYANQADAITYGATLNNNPTVQDVWNATGAWGYPFTGGAELTSPVIYDLGGVVAGLGGYSDWGNGIYTELTFYSDTGAIDATDIGLPSSTMTDARINGVAPYARLTWSNNFSTGDTLMVGAFGMQTALYDDTGASAGHDTYTDIAVDTQYTHALGNGDDISLHATYTNEAQTLDYSDPGYSPTLNSFNVNGIYHWGHKATATLAYNQNTGSGLNPANPDAYNDSAWTAQLSYLPWQNTKFTLQYVAYTELEGSTDNVSDNNTALLQGWFMW